MVIYNKTKEILIADQVKVANSFLTRLVGLLNKSSLSSSEALIIRPCKAIHTWLMKFSIDVLFLDENNKVIHIMENMVPGRKSPFIKKSHQVIELQAGKIALTGTEISDEIIIKEEQF